MNDEELMQAYIEGNMEAFESLYARHKGRIFAYLMTRVRDRSEAEDIFQAVFAKLHRSRHQYRQEIPFLPWIFTITRNSLIDHIRSKEAYAKHIIVSEEAVYAYAEPVSDDAPMHAVTAEMTKLNQNQRRAIELRFNQGLTFEEIAEQMQTSADNARQLISRAIRKLRGLITDKEEHRENK